MSGMLTSHTCVHARTVFGMADAPHSHLQLPSFAKLHQDPTGLIFPLRVAYMSANALHDGVPLLRRDWRTLYWLQLRHKWLLWQNQLLWDN